jgi:peptide alpha-N-acetyltransferase
MKLHDSPSKSSAEEDDEMAKLPAAQRKKLRQKQKKAEARAKRVTSTRFRSVNSTLCFRSVTAKPVLCCP